MIKLDTLYEYDLHLAYTKCIKAGDCEDVIHCYTIIDGLSVWGDATDETLFKIAQGFLDKHVTETDLSLSDGNEVWITKNGEKERISTIEIDHQFGFWFNM